MGDVRGEREHKKKVEKDTCPLPLQNWLCHYGVPYKLQA